MIIFIAGIIITYFIIPKSCGKSWFEGYGKGQPSKNCKCLGRMYSSWSFDLNQSTCTGICYGCKCYQTTATEEKEVPCD